MPAIRWLNNRRRNGGIHISATVVIPTNVNKVYAELDSSEFDDPSASITIKIDVLQDSNWISLGHVVWLGGTEPGRSGKFYLELDLTAWQGHHVRAYIESTGTFRWGIQGEIS